jgi:hypothetical protein
MNTFLRLSLARGFLIVLVAAAGYAILSKHVSTSPSGKVLVSSDVLAYVDAARNMIEGRNIYLDDAGARNSYVYPPFFAFVCIPLTLIPPLAVDIIWYILNIALVIAALRLGTMIATGRSFSSLAGKEQWFYAGLSILCSLRYLIRNAQDANVNMVILVLMILGLHLAEKTGRPAWSALIGIAAAIKVLPLLFIVYFAGKRDWRAFMYVLGGFVAATMLPIVATGAGAWFGYLRMFVDYSRSQFSPQGLEIENFSFWGTLGRLLSHQKAFDGPDGSPVFINVASLPLGAIRAMVYCINAALSGIVFEMGRRARRQSDPDHPRNAGLFATLVAISLSSILIEDHHTVAFMAAYLFLLVCWKNRYRLGNVSLALITGSGLLSLLLSYDIVVPLFGKYAYMILLSLSLPVLPVGILLLGYLIGCSSGPRAQAPTVFRTS